MKSPCNVLEELQELLEAHQLTQNNLPNLSDKEELALLIYANFYRFEGMPPNELGFSSRNQMGNRQDFRTWDSLRDIL